MSTNTDWNPGVAAVLSLVIPGAGQIYKGQIFNGLFWLLCVVIGYAMFVFPGVLLHVFCIIGAYSGKSAAPTAKTQDQDDRVKCPDCRELVMKDARKCKHCGCHIAVSVSEYAKFKGISEEQVMEKVREGIIYAEKMDGEIVINRGK